MGVRKPEGKMKAETKCVYRHVRARAGRKILPQICANLTAWVGFAFSFSREMLKKRFIAIRNNIVHVEVSVSKKLFETLI